MPEPVLNKLPSISQLMELRPLKDLAGRISSSAVMAGVKSYLEPYQRRAMAAAPLPFTSLQDLAQGISAWLLGEAGMGRPEVINATGQLLGRRFPVSPLSDEVVLDAHGRRHDYACADAAQSFRTICEQRLCDMTGAPSALIVRSREAAILLAAAALGERSAAISRTQIATTFDGVSIPSMLEGGLLRGVEVGASDQIDLHALRQQIENKQPIAWWLDRSNFEGARLQSEPSTQESLQAWQSAAFERWVDIGIAGLTQNTHHQEMELCSAARALELGASLVLVGCGFLLGGPPCAALLGSRHATESIRGTAMFPHLIADLPVLAELEATLRIHQSGERVEDRLPVLSLLTTEVENLELRAGRIREQLATSEMISSVEVETAEVCGLPGIGPFETRRLCIEQRAADLPPEETRLNVYPAIIPAQQTENRIVLDLRSVFPRQDSLIVDRFL